jgi:hypothetical protein
MSCSAAVRSGPTICEQQRAGADGRDVLRRAALLAQPRHHGFVLHLARRVDAAADDQDVERRAGLEIMVGEDADLRVGHDRVLRLRDDEDLEVRHEAEDLLRGQRIEHRHAVPDVDPDRLHVEAPSVRGLSPCGAT